MEGDGGRERESNVEGDGVDGGSGWREGAEVMEVADGGRMVSGGGGWGRCARIGNGGWGKCTEVGGRRGDGGRRRMERRKVEDGVGA